MPVATPVANANPHAARGVITGAAVPPEKTTIATQAVTVSAPINVFTHPLPLFFAEEFALNFVSGDGAGLGKGVVLGAGVGVSVFGVAFYVRVCYNN